MAQHFGELTSWVPTLQLTLTAFVSPQLRTTIGFVRLTPAVIQLIRTR